MIKKLIAFNHDSNESMTAFEQRLFFLKVFWVVYLSSLVHSACVPNTCLIKSHFLGEKVPKSPVKGIYRGHFDPYIHVLEWCFPFVWKLSQRTDWPEKWVYNDV